jgi:3-isopropylmalate/(R)-2-methylmalate dehydratase small subunit
MNKSLKIQGRIWVLRDKEGKPIDDIDTDMIYHNAHLAITDINEMGKYTFGNLEEWKDFSQKAQKGDIIIAGKNFGCGSSRQHAVDCFISLGILLIIAESFAAIYKRNAINSGFPILTCSTILQPSPEEDDYINQGDILKTNLSTGNILNVTKNKEVKPCQPFSQVQKDIYLAGDLFSYGRTLLAKKH